MAIGYFLSGVTSLITMTADQRELARSVLSWMPGSMAGTLGLPAAALLAGVT